MGYLLSLQAMEAERGDHGGLALASSISAACTHHSGLSSVC